MAAKTQGEWPQRGQRRPSGGLEQLLRTLRVIEDHRTDTMERTLRDEYSRTLRELQQYLSDEFLRYGEDGSLDFAALNRSGEHARFLEEVLAKVQHLTSGTSAAIRGMVEEMYTLAYEGVLDAVDTLAGDSRLAQVLQPIRRVRPEVLQAAVQNPVSGLTLDETLEWNRHQIIYDIKRSITNGIMNGDSYTTMASRLHEVLNGDYKKAMRIVRTETHRVQEQGHYDGMAEVDEKLKDGAVRVYKIWRTMKDERVRPQRGLSKKTGKRLASSGKADHVKMEGVTVLRDEEFDLGHGVTTLIPGSSGNAADDIHCRCFVEYVVRDADEKEVTNLTEPLDGAAADDIIDVEAVSKTLRKVEGEIRGLDHEVGAVIGRDGRLLNKTQGEAHSVNPPKDLLKGNIFTHNHPSGGTFSTDDIRNFVSDGLYEVRAVTPQGTVYRMRWGEGEKNTQLAQDVMAYPFWTKTRERKGISLLQAFNEVMEEWLTENADIYGYLYMKGNL
ncbi:phage head morphogenesis protein [Ruminococcaceae bacterium OttesenSCG-928-I18]|nr:phage head morphogenesis protein [Ruminococcaceae bacterium OttesenSCG-928-I18]